MTTLLIVDENAIHRRLYEKEFKKEGFSVLTTPSGVEALALMETYSPNLVILDPTIFSDMKGEDILDRLIERKPALPVVLHTSYYAFRNDPMVQRAQAFVLKSSNLGELKSKVRDLLREEGRERLLVRLA